MKADGKLLCAILLVLLMCAPEGPHVRVSTDPRPADIPLLTDPGGPLHLPFAEQRTSSTGAGMQVTVALEAAVDSTLLPAIARELGSLAHRTLRRPRQFPLHEASLPPPAC